VQLNQILLVFGEVVADVKRGTLRMDKPIHILKDKVQSHLNSRAHYCFTLLSGSGVNPSTCC
jgi:hypothetical protein